jgi:hypothetical protein
MFPLILSPSRFKRHDYDPRSPERPFPSMGNNLPIWLTFASFKLTFLLYFRIEAKASYEAKSNLMGPPKLHLFLILYDIYEDTHVDG